MGAHIHTHSVLVASVCKPCATIFRDVTTKKLFCSFFFKHFSFLSSQFLLTLDDVDGFNFVASHFSKLRNSRGMKISEDESLAK